MPSSLRSKIHSGPVKRSCVRVAAIGSSQSGRVFIELITCIKCTTELRITSAP